MSTCLASAQVTAFSCMTNSRSKADETGPPSAPVSARFWHISDIHLSLKHPPGAADTKTTPQIANRRAFDTDWLDHLCRYATSEPAHFLVFSGDFIEAREVTQGTVETAQAIPSDTADPKVSRLDSLVSFFFSEQKGKSRTDQSASRKVCPTVQAEAFAEAERCIRRLATAHGLESQLSTRVVVCPGNHDSTWPKKVATQGNASPGVAMIPHNQPSFDAFNSTFKDYVRPDSGNPYSLIAELRVALMVLNTARLGGAEFKDGEGVIKQEDAGSFHQTEIKDAFALLGGAWEGAPGANLPPQYVGLVVCHHPPSVIPTPTTEIKPYEISIGAGAAKDWLFDVGMRVFLHGHKHVCVVQREAVHKATSSTPHMVAVLGASALLGNGKSTPGFNVVDCTASPICGGVWLKITPHLFIDHTPTSSPEPIRVSLPSRTKSAARLIRLIERISEFGDCRTDTTWHDIPVPRGEHDEQGWTASGRAHKRVFERRHLAPQCHAGYPLARQMVPEVRVHVSRPTSLRGVHEWTIEVEAEPGVRSVSLFERTNWAGGYATSVNHQRRVWKAAQPIPDLDPGWEYFIHMMRDPAERLELFVRLPFATNEDLQVELRTYVETADGRFSSAPEFLEYSSCLIERALFAKRIRVAVTKPVTGVAYAVHWMLPMLSPSDTKLSVGERTARAKAEGEAEGLREAMFGLSEEQRAEMNQLLHSALTPILEELRTSEPELTEDKIEWALFVPDQKIWPLGIPEGDEAVVSLRPMLASFEGGSQLWKQSWLPGYGIAGRAYAVGQLARYRRAETTVGPDSGWDETAVDLYLALPESRPHSVLYGIPLLHPKREQGDVIWGCLCIGTYVEHAQLDLSRYRREQIDVSLTVLLYNQLVEFSSKFWQKAAGYQLS